MVIQSSSQSTNMEEPTAFKTLAFIDLETTGLPQFEQNRTKITQLSIVACSVEHIKDLTDEHSIPRVLHKLTLCFNPFKLIKLDVSAITGLSNELLEHERKFDENTADIIINFLGRLQQPVMLVAHNGVRFDYPILKKQLRALNKPLPETTLCCDSFEIFRRIDEIYAENSKTLINGYRLTSWEKLKDETIAMMDAEILEIQSIFENYTPNDDEDEAVTELENEYLTLSQERIKEEEKSALDEMKERQILNETTPNKSTRPENKIPQPKANGNGRKSPAGASRRLFPNDASPSTSTTNGNGTSPSKRWPKGTYKLSNIYCRLFGEEPPNCHDAEGDVIALMKCVIARKKEFLQVANSMNYKFCDVKEL